MLETLVDDISNVMVGVAGESCDSCLDQCIHQLLSILCQQTLHHS